MEPETLLQDKLLTHFARFPGRLQFGHFSETGDSEVCDVNIHELDHIQAYIKSMFRALKISNILVLIFKLIRLTFLPHPKHCLG